MAEYFLFMVSGDQIIEALENGVSQYPKLEGRFPQVSGLTFGFDPTLTPGCRVDQSSITIGGEHLDKNKVSFPLNIERCVNDDQHLQRCHNNQTMLD